MWINSDGSVGIGTTAPSNHLDIVGSGNQDIKVRSDSPSGNWAGVALEAGSGVQTHYFANDTEGGVGTNSAHNFSLRTQALDRLTVSSAGNVGIGSAAPGTALDVNGTIRGSHLSTTFSGCYWTGWTCGTASCPNNYIVNGILVGYINVCSGNGPNYQVYCCSL